MSTHFPTDLLFSSRDDPFRSIHFGPSILSVCVLSLYRACLGHLYTLYLFTRSDMKTILIPTVRPQSPPPGVFVAVLVRVDCPRQ